MTHPTQPETTQTAQTTADAVTSPSADPAAWGLATRSIHAGQVPDSDAGSRALPLHQTTSYVFADADQAANRFALAELGPIYTRLNNPTTQAVEDRLAALDGGVGALLLSSGQSATTFSLLNLCRAGDHVVASAHIYGGTQNLLAVTLEKLGIHTTFVQEPNDPAAWRQATQANTKAYFAETIANPSGLVLDVRAVADAAHEAGVPLIVDNTVATPALLRPLEHGADVVVYSATKFLGGHGTAIAGAIVDGGTFDYGAHGDRYPNFTEPDASYNGLVFARDLGADGAFGVNLSYILRARVCLLRDLGSAPSPFNAWLIAQGLETLTLRMEKHVANAHEVARWLDARPEVTRVQWAGLVSHPCHELAQRYLPTGPGSVLSFELAGGEEAGRAFVSALELFSHVANIGDVRSLVIHPASTTHAQLSEAERLAAGVTPGLVRLSVGIEDAADLLADLERGLASAGVAR
ncbi:O-acetylhomoserine aminocarboxypropyltransferase/cysteine synthase family protein [Kytococcus sedentarius]|uniref:O-acetylhomoserine aminocarboxypropyltransferase/cysteine synthase family protein n=1 Tax=Kytococcus sedentarius TaxID=1276 RepID=UPI0035BC63A9